MVVDFGLDKEGEEHLSIVIKIRKIQEGTVDKLAQTADKLVHHQSKQSFAHFI
jgi:hypothetical protein